MQFPQQTYKWLVSIHIIPNEGISTQKNLVSIPPNLVSNFQSGYNISAIITSIVERSNKKVPASLVNIRKQTNNKNVTLTNWNFVWLAFNDLNMQFSPRLKQLILQGENTLIVQIVKQLYEKDKNKDLQAIRNVSIKDNIDIAKLQKSLNKQHQDEQTLDIKKIDLQKNPSQSNSSLEYLILILAQSMSMNLEQILGLFSDNNHYLAYLIVKGLNDNYESIMLFYQLLNRYSNKLKQFYSEDRKDAESCMYAIKPGFVSKNQQVAKMTLQLFWKLGDLYHWLTNQESKGGHTLLLGIKRHPQMTDLYWGLLVQIISQDDLGYFRNHYRKSFDNDTEALQISMHLLKSIGQSYLYEELLAEGIINEWIQEAVSIFNRNKINEQILVYIFLREALLWMPQSITNNLECLIVFRSGWKKRNYIQFTQLINELFVMLEQLASQSNSLVGKVYEAIIDIFDQVSQNQDKASYIVSNFCRAVQRYPKMPNNFFIEQYNIQKSHINANDFQLFVIAINTSTDEQGVIKIGEVLLKYFTKNAVINYWAGNLIYQIIKKVFANDLIYKFTKKCIKDVLNLFINLELNKFQTSKMQPYINNKGSSVKSSEQETIYNAVKDKQMANYQLFLQKISIFVLKKGNLQLQTFCKEQFMDANAYIRKNNFKVASKGITNILRKFNITQDDEKEHDGEYKIKKQKIATEQSRARADSIKKNLTILAASRIPAPENLRQELSQIVEKRKKQEQQKKIEEYKRRKVSQTKQHLVKKSLQNLQVLRGFGNGEAQPKEWGFWGRYIKEDPKQIQLYPEQLMQDHDLGCIQNTLKKYHRVMRHLFVKYTGSMYSVKSINNFDDNHTRKEVITAVELIKMLKDYKLFFLTNNSQIQNLVRDINVKMLSKRQNYDLDFYGFEIFMIQFAVNIFVRTHVFNDEKAEIVVDMIYSSHCQQLQEVFNYIKLAFVNNGQSVAIFNYTNDEANSNQSSTIKELNQKLRRDPKYILPQGYKKVTYKNYHFQPFYNKNVTQRIKPSILDVTQIIDEILYQALSIHMIEPVVQVQTITMVKVNPFTLKNIKPRVMDSLMQNSRGRAMSTLITKKSHPALPINANRDHKSIMIDSQEKKNSHQRKMSLRKLNQPTRFQVQQQLLKKKQEQQRQKQQKIRIQLLIQKKKKQQQNKYMIEIKQKLSEKKKKEAQQNMKKINQQNKKKDEQLKRNKQKFKQLNTKIKDKIKQDSHKIIEQKKKKQQQAIAEQKRQQNLSRRLQNKIQAQNQRLIQIREKNNEQISQLYNSPQIVAIFSRFNNNLTAIYEFLVKNTYISITQRKHNNQIILQTWNYFALAFQLNPFILTSKQALSIFRSLTKSKHLNKNYILGLNFDQFKQGLLRVAIKHKSVFNKISEKISESTMTQSQINDVVQKDIDQKQQEDEAEYIDIKSLLVQEDINLQVPDDYGDISKVTPDTLRGLIYYLKVPKDKAGQDKRFREIIASDGKTKHSQKQQKLRQKLKQKYSLASSPKNKTKSPKKASQNIIQEQPKQKTGISKKNKKKK